MFKVFVGSTYLDLVPERNAVLAALQRLRATKFVGMEFFGSHDAGTARMSFDELDRCDVCVGIFGLRYGSGITEAEYDRAVQRHLPCLPYLKQPQAPGPLADAPQERFRARVLARHSASLFASADELATLIVADLHNLMFDRLLVVGMEQLRSDYDHRIRRFVEEYLGVPGQPIAFGGREAPLLALDSWLDGADQPAYAMLVAPAGRGKSALLVHWVQSLLPREALDVVFFPISVRFSTNRANVALASIAARLAALHGEIVPGGVDTPVQVWRSILLSYLARRPPPGRRLLLVLDGLDEAADEDRFTDLLPRQPLPGLKVLASARTLAGDRGAAGWIGRLKWDQRPGARPFELAPLSLDGLTRVLQTMGVPLTRLSRRTDVVRELFRLSQGDPLLVQLYVADLWVRGESVARLQPEDLAAIEPGLAGYFERWWSDQRELWGVNSPLREPLVNEILETLACAQGPLLAQQLLALLSGSQHTSVWGLEDALRVLGRFVIGDGLAQGYAFSHPRLGYHFFERLERVGQGARFHERFVQWGLAQLKAGGNAEVPLYVLQHLRAHMQRAGRPLDELMMFSSRDWARAWAPHDRGSYTGYLADVAQVASLAQGANADALTRGHAAPYMAIELRCALVTLSARNQAAELPAPALAALVREGRWSAAQAVAFVQKDPDDARRCVTLLELADAQPAEQASLTLAAAGVEILALADRGASLEALSQRLHALGAAGRRAVYAERYLAALRSVHRLADLWPEHRQDELALLRTAPDGVELPRFLRVQAAQALGQAAGAFWEYDPRLDTQHDAPLGTVLAAAQARRAGVYFSELAQATMLRRALPLLSQLALHGPAAERGEAYAAALACAGALRLRPDECLAIAPCLAPRDAQRLLERALSELVDDVDTQQAIGALLRRLDRRQRHALAPVCLQALPMVAPEPEPALLLKLFEGLAPADVEPLLPALAAAAPFASLAHALNGLLARRQVASGAARSTLLAALRTGLTPEERVTVAAALVDVLAPKGHADALESWRTTADPALGSALRHTLAPAEEALRDALWTEIQRPGQPALRDAVGGMLQLNVWRTEGGRMPVQAPPCEGSIAEELLLWWQSREGDDGPVAGLDDKVMAAAGYGLAARLSLLASLAPWLPDTEVDGALARMCREHSPYYRDSDAPDVEIDLDRAIVLLGKAPLFPPSPDALQAIGDLFGNMLAWLPELGERVRRQAMPDLLREAWLLQELRAPARNSPPGAAAGSPASLALRLPQATPALTALALGDAERADLEALALRLPPQLLARWLARAVGHLPEHLDSLFDALRRNPGYADEATLWRETIEALRLMADGKLAIAWLAWAVMGLPEAQHADALRLARSLVDPFRRRAAINLLLPLLPQADARPLLLQALADAAGGLVSAAAARALVQLALTQHGGDTEVTACALDTALRIEDRPLRADALVELSTVLSAGRLETALAQAQAAEDAAARVGALLACADMLGPGAAAVLQHAWVAARSMRDGPAKAQALIQVAHRLNGGERFQALEQALAVAPDLPSSTGRADTLMRLAGTLHDAPLALLERGVRWMHGAAADDAREAAALHLCPAVPDGLQPLVIEMLGGWSLPRAAAWWSDATAALARRRLQRVHDQTWQLQAFDAARSPPSAVPAAPDLDPHRTWSDLQTLHLVEACMAAAMPAPPVAAALVRHACAIADPELRRRAGALLAPLASDADLGDAVEAALAIPAPGARALTLARIAARAPADLQGRLRVATTQSLHLALRDDDRTDAGRLAARVVLTMPGWGPAVMLGLQEAGDDDSRSAAWVVLAIACASGLDTLAAAILDPIDRVRAIVQSAPRLGGAAAAAALALSAALPTAALRARSLVALVPRLEAAARTEALALLDGITADHAWLEALLAVAARWPAALDDSRLQRALRELPALGNPEQVGDRFVRLAALCAPAHAAALTTAAAALTSPSHQSEALSILLSHEPAAAGRIEPHAAAIADPFHRVVLQLHLADCGCGDPAAVVAAARRLGRRRAIDAFALAALRGGRLLPQAFDALLALAADPSIWTALVPSLDADQAARLAQLAPNGELLLALVPVLGPIEHHRVLDAVGRLDNPREQARVLCDMAPAITDEAVAGRAMALAMMLPRSYRTEALVGVMAALADGRREWLWSEYWSQRDPVVTWRQLERLLPLLPASLGPQVQALVEALAPTPWAEAARKAVQCWRADPLPVSPPTSVDSDPQWLRGLLRHAAQDRPGGSIPNAPPSSLAAWAERLRHARRERPLQRAAWLCQNACALPSPLHGQALELTWDLPPGPALARAMAALAPALGPQWNAELHRLWLDRLAGSPRLRVGDVCAAVAALLPVLQRLGPPDAVAAVAAELG